MSALGGAVKRLDAKLAWLARGETALRLRLGQVLEVLSRGGHFDLGFSSVAAYALERCDRSVRWAEAARCLARRVEHLPVLRRAMACGQVSWSMGELLARVAQPEDEARWLGAAESRTVRQMRVLVAERMTDAREAMSAGLGDHAAKRGATGERGDGQHHADDGLHGSDGDDEETCTLTCTVDQEDAWLFEATRSLLEQFGVQGSDAQSEALLAEGQTTLLEALPTGSLDADRWEGSDAARQQWLAELGRRRAEAEVLCEGRIRSLLLASREPGQEEGQEQSRESAPIGGPVAVAAALGFAALERATGDELDGHVRTLSGALARHELELSRLMLMFHRLDGWRRLGYASETQYARERLGVSRSSVLGRRSLALRLEKLPRVATALGAGLIGVEAALQVVRVATAGTETAWVERARQRTIKHLREEVTAALTAVRVSGNADCPPPADAELADFQALEQAVVSGRVYEHPPAKDVEVTGGVDTRGMAEPASEERRAWFVMLASLARWLESGFQLSAAGSNAAGSSPGSSVGRIALRLRMSPGTYAWWRGLEVQARCWLPMGMSWLRFLCLSMWHAWRHLLGADVAYGRIYVRDRYRCTSPVCSRRDVTPHHLRFRSAGGSDEDDNVASVCTWCHLCGVHGGRIRAEGTAECIRWEFGAPDSPCLVVHGRKRAA
jgi:hypothetical protein